MAELLEAKQSGGEVAAPAETPDDGAAVVDLMSALRRSVERARGGGAALPRRGEKGRSRYPAAARVSVLVKRALASSFGARVAARWRGCTAHS